MKYEASVIPEGINSTNENPLKELLLLVSGAVAVIALLIYLVAFLSDFLIGFISTEMEASWFRNQSLDLSLYSAQLDENDLPLEHQFEDLELYLTRLISRLKTQDGQDFQFSVTIFAHHEPNAFIIPGGHIFVSDALFQNVESENGLAMVMAHEMAHQYERHPIRSLGRGVLIRVALGAVLGTEATDWLSSLFFEAATIGQLAFSREQEREADRIAVDILIAHYGHALGSDEFFRNINAKADSSSAIPEFYQSHPGTAERIQLLKKKNVDAKGQKTALPEWLVKFTESEN
ncbi:MAG: putative Zn-dependent protease [Gammaproteobacteria bacterium]|jgi:predicted Zn-dependent protease